MKNGGKRRGVVGLTEYGSLALFVVAVAAVAAAVFGSCGILRAGLPSPSA